MGKPNGWIHFVYPVAVAIVAGIVISGGAVTANYFLVEKPNRDDTETSRERDDAGDALGWLIEGIRACRGEGFSSAQMEEAVQHKELALALLDGDNYKQAQLEALSGLDSLTKAGCVVAEDYRDLEIEVRA
jgi:hypothetical protein